MAQTIYTGDTLQSIPVISHLNVSDLPAGCHQFWFSASSNALAQNNLLPVWVFKGAKKVSVYVLPLEFMVMNLMGY